MLITHYMGTAFDRAARVAQRCRRSQVCEGRDGHDEVALPAGGFSTALTASERRAAVDEQQWGTGELRGTRAGFPVRRLVLARRSRAKAHVAWRLPRAYPLREFRCIVQLAALCVAGSQRGAAPARGRGLSI